MWAVGGLCVYFVFSFTQWAGESLLKSKAARDCECIIWSQTVGQIFVTTVWLYKQMAAISAVSSKERSYLVLGLQLN